MLDENCPMFIAATTDQVIDYEPAADVAPVVHGEWLNIDGDYTFAACSICKTEYEVATEEEAEKGLMGRVYVFLPLLSVLRR